MKHEQGSIPRRVLVAGALVLMTPGLAQAAPTAAAAAQFNSYIGGVETRLAREHASTAGFLAPVDTAPLRRGEFMIEELTPATGAEMDNALLHDWRGTAFAPGATAAGFERLMRDFENYPKYFSPQVIHSRIVAQQDDHYQVTMRVRQHHILTVVMDTSYDVVFARADSLGGGAVRGYSISRSTRVAEIDAPGTAHERALAPSEDHGFLWRMNTYWSYAEGDGGLYIQVESVSLSRSIPAGLGWAIEPFIVSVPRESLEFTLRSACQALRR